MPKIIILSLIGFLLLSCSFSNKLSNEQINRTNISFLLNNADNYIKKNDYRQSLPYLLTAYNSSLLLKHDSIAVINLAFTIAKAYYLCNNDSLFNVWNLKSKGLSIMNNDLYNSKVLFFEIDTLFEGKHFNTLSQFVIPNSYSAYTDEYYLASARILYAKYMVNKSNVYLLNKLIDEINKQSIYYLETKAYICLIIGELLSLVNRFNEANIFYNNAIDLAIKTNYLFLAAIAYEKLGDLNLKLSNKEYITNYIKSSDFYLMCNDTLKSNGMLIKSKL
jgi:tetratricopeptide (TPR) repeat protein